MARLTRHWKTAVIVAVIAGVAAVVALRLADRPPERSAPAFCAELTAAQDLDEGLASLDPDRLDPQVAALARARAVAPPEIEPTVTAVLDLVEDLRDTIDAAPGDRVAAVEEALRAHQADVPRAEFAGVVLEDYARNTCALQLSGAAPA